MTPARRNAEQRERAHENERERRHLARESPGDSSPSVAMRREKVVTNASKARLRQTDRAACWARGTRSGTRPCCAKRRRARRKPLRGSTRARGCTRRRCPTTPVARVLTRFRRERGFVQGGNRTAEPAIHESEIASAAVALWATGFAIGDRSPRRPQGDGYRAATIGAFADFRDEEALIDKRSDDQDDRDADERANAIELVQAAEIVQEKLGQRHHKSATPE